MVQCYAVLEMREQENYKPTLNKGVGGDKQVTTPHHLLTSLYFIKY